MRVVKIGGRFSESSGLGFFGVDDVNALLGEGYVITGLRPEGALMSKHVEEGTGKVTWALSGFAIDVELQLKDHQA